MSVHLLPMPTQPPDPRLAQIAAKVRAQFDESDHDRANAILFLSQSIDEIGPARVARLLQLVDRFGLDRVQRWARNVAQTRQEGR